MQRYTCWIVCGAAVLVLGLGAGGCAKVPVAPPAESDVADAQGVVVQFLVESGQRGQAMRGFVLQEVASEAELGTGRRRAGIFVGTATNRSIRAAQGDYTPALGDVLHVRGQRKSLGGRPAIVDVELLEVRRRGVDLAREFPPFDVSPPADLASAEAYWAAREGMRGRLPAGAIVQGAHYGSYDNPASSITVIRGDLPWLAGRGPYAKRVFRDAHPLDDAPALLVNNGNGFRITLGDGALKHHRDDPGAMLPLLRTFDILAAPVEGVVLRTSGQHRLHVDDIPAFSPGPDPALNQAPAPDTEAGGLRVATFNIENLYDHRDDPFDPNDDVVSNARNDREAGVTLQNYVAESAEAYATRLRNLAGQILEALQAPDVLMLQEVEDQDIGVMQDGVLVETTVNDRDGVPDVLQELAAEIVRQGGPSYRPVGARAGADDRGIVCAFLVREDRLRVSDVPATHPLLSGVPVLPEAGRVVAYGFAAANPRALNAHVPGQGLVAPRAPQVLCVEAAPGVVSSLRPGQHLYLVNNHFKSRPQQYAAERRAQAKLAGAIAAALMQHEPGAGVVVGGDLNTFPRPDEPVPEAPADQLEGLYAVGLHNLYDAQVTQHPEGAYTYVYEGQAQTLDHLFVSPNLNLALRDVRALHINADYGPNPRMPLRHCSDHDPVVAVFAPWR